MVLLETETGAFLYVLIVVVLQFSSLPLLLRPDIPLNKRLGCKTVIAVRWLGWPEPVLVELANISC